MSLKPFALIAPDACVVTCGYRLHSEIISRSHLLIRQPEVFIKSGQENKVCKLVKSIYGLKQAKRVWYETISKTLQKKLGFQQLHSDAGVHVLRQ